MGRVERGSGRAWGQRLSQYFRASGVCPVTSHQAELTYAISLGKNPYSKGNCYFVYVSDNFRSSIKSEF